MSNNTNGRGFFWKTVAAATVGAGLLGVVYWYRRPIATWNRDEEKNAEGSLIRRFLPQAEFVGEVAVDIHATPETIYAALQNVTLNDMPIANWLGRLRYLPGTLSGQTHHEDAATNSTPFIQVIQSESGNIVLAEEYNREFVIGAIGKFHNLLNQQIVPLRSAAEFVAFDQPDYQKLAMSFRLTPLADGSGQRLTLVHGTHALGQEARWKFALYWIGIKPGGNFVTWLMLRAIKSIAEKMSETSEHLTEK